MLQPIERRLPLFATFLSFVFSGGLLMGSNGYLPPPRPCEGGSDPRPCAGYNSAWSHFWISEPTHRHERTDWRPGMEDWHEKAWTANQNQRDRLPRKDGAGASDCGRSALHPPSTPPPNRLWYLPYLGIRSSLVAATASMSGCPATANIFDGTAWSLLLTDRGRLHSLI